jgi:hypothetical protein
MLTPHISEIFDDMQSVSTNLRRITCDETSIWLSIYLILNNFTGVLHENIYPYFYLPNVYFQYH